LLLFTVRDQTPPPSFTLNGKKCPKFIFKL
jgi:hypothetical protein